MPWISYDTRIYSSCIYETVVDSAELLYAWEWEPVVRVYVCLCAGVCVLTPGFLEAYDIDPTHGRRLYHLPHTLMQSCDLWKQKENTIQINNDK